MSNSLDPDQARQSVGPDLGPNCLQRLSADDTNRKRVKSVSGMYIFCDFIGIFLRIKCIDLYVFQCFSLHFDIFQFRRLKFR